MNSAAETVGKDTAPHRLGSRFGMALLAFFMRLLPARMAYGFAIFPVVYYFIAKPKARRSAYILFHRLGYRGGRLKRWWFAARQIHMFAQIIMDNMYLGLFGNRKFTIHEFGTELFLDQIKRGKGLMLLSAHVGNWHLAVNFMHNTKTHVHLVMDDARSEAVQKAMDAAKDHSDHLTLHAADQGPALAFELTAALRRGEVVIIAGDRTRGEGRKTQVPFLGKPAYFPTAPLLLAKAAGAPVCTALTFRRRMHEYDCYGLGPFEAPEDTPVKARAEYITAAFAGTLETYLRKYPTQWFNFYDFWEGAKG